MKIKRFAAAAALTGLMGLTACDGPAKSPEACFACHFDKKAEFSLPYHHPVLEGRVNCIDCHDPHGSDVKRPASLALARNINDTCAKCHREQTQEKVYRHDALREGCTICHSVHGSMNRKLLVQGDVNLCLKCHAEKTLAPGSVPIGPGLSNHSARIGGGPCWGSGCHTAVHGSNVSSALRF